MLLFNDLPVARNPRDKLSHKVTGGDRSVKPAHENTGSKNYRGGHVVHENKSELRALARDVEDFLEAWPDTWPVVRFKPGKAENCDGLTKKRARAIGMFEGWREVINEPVRQRVGLAGMQY